MFVKKRKLNINILTFKYGSISLVLNQDTKCLILHLQVDYFIAIKHLSTIVDTIAIVMLLRLVLEKSTKAVQVITCVVEGVVVVTARELLNLAFDPILIQFYVLRAPVNLEPSLEEASLRIKYQHGTHAR